MNTLYLIRGLSGAGKSTKARTLTGHPPFEADDFFMVGGVYQFDPTFLPAAHATCLRHVRRALAIRDCAVANTFIRRWEMEPYFEMAAEIGAHIEVIDLYDGGKSDAELAARNVHGVPERVIAAQRARYETLAVISL